MAKSADVLIIGAGVIGLSSAVELSKKGAKVLLIDQGQVGHGCSYGNAGWLTPCFALPLPRPGLMWKSFKWMMNPEGPLYIKPSLSLNLAQWLFQFMRAMNLKQTQSAMEALIRLSVISLSEYEKLAAEFPEMDFHKKGLLMVSQTEDGVRSAREELLWVKDYDIHGKSLNGEEIKKMEPALRGNLTGGVYFPNEAHVEPMGVVQALQKKFLALGGSILEKVQFQTATVESGICKSIQTNAGTMLADQYVLATGSWSKDLAKAFNLSVPILGGKGYALISNPLPAQPQYPMMFVEKKIAITPRKNSLRIAGTLELVDQDFSLTERRVEALKKGASEFLSIPENNTYTEVWRGLRPCTPDGVPLIGFSSRVSNLMLACGHQMLGLQSGYGTGMLVADLARKGKSDLNYKVFNPNRFA